MHPHHPHLSEAVLVHALAWIIALAFFGLGVLIVAKLFAPEIQALLSGLGG
jgi:hypothetical protein